MEKEKPNQVEIIDNNSDTEPGEKEINTIQEAKEDSANDEPAINHASTAQETTEEDSA